MCLCVMEVSCLHAHHMQRPNLWVFGLALPFATPRARTRRANLNREARWTGAPPSVRISTSGFYLTLNVLNSRRPPLGPDLRGDCGLVEGSKRATWGPLESSQVLANSWARGVGRTSKLSWGCLWALCDQLTAYVLTILNRYLMRLKALNGPVKYR